MLSIEQRQEKAMGITIAVLLVAANALIVGYRNLQLQLSTSEHRTRGENQPDVFV